MVKFIRERELIESVSYELFFPVNGPGWGFSFTCDKAGKVFPPKAEAAQANLKKCLALQAEGKVKGEIMTCPHRYWEPAVIVCPVCNRKVSLRDTFYSACECGQGFNGSGQVLLPPDQWEKDY